MTIGALAKTYGLLPSQVQANATTFDIMVMDVMTTWEEYQQNKAEGKPAPPPQLSQDELLKILKESRGKQ